MIDPTSGEIDSLERYLSALDPPDIAAARHVATIARESGMPLDDFVESVLRPAQAEVGRRWQKNQWTVAQEHAATAITDAVLTMLTPRSVPLERSQASIVSGCVEGEWHTMPARMLGATLAVHGHDLIFLGPSLPAARFARSLNDLRPRAALLSCTTALNLPAARRTIEVAHHAGVLVIIGGAALDAGGVRAKALGADACAADAAGAASILASWEVDRPVPARPAQLCAEGAELEVPQPGLVADCLAELLQREPDSGEMTTDQLDRTCEDITDILRFCSAALVTRDHTVLDEFTTWLRDLLAGRNVPARTIRTSYECIAAVLGGGFPQTTRMLTAAASSI